MSFSFSIVFIFLLTSPIQSPTEQKEKLMGKWFCLHDYFVYRNSKDQQDRNIIESLEIYPENAIITFNQADTSQLTVSSPWAYNGTLLSFKSDDATIQGKCYFLSTSKEITDLEYELTHNSDENVEFIIFSHSKTHKD